MNIKEKWYSTNYLPLDDTIKYLLGLLNSILVNFFFFIKQTSANINRTPKVINYIPIVVSSSEK